MNSSDTSITTYGALSADKNSVNGTYSNSLEHVLLRELFYNRKHSLSIFLFLYMSSEIYFIDIPGILSQK